jgi:hypothetical protein
MVDPILRLPFGKLRVAQDRPGFPLFHHVMPTWRDGTGSPVTSALSPLPRLTSLRESERAGGGSMSCRHGVHPKGDKCDLFNKTIIIGGPERPAIRRGLFI